MRTVETVVIGGGAMGSSTAWALARHGHSVALIEQFEDGHANGASHGEYRNFNIGYHQPHFVDMLAESWRLWHELEVDSGQSLLEIVGLVNHGHNAYTDEIIQAVTNAGFRAKYLDSNEASERWPGLKFDGRVLHSSIPVESRLTSR